MIWRAGVLATIWAMEQGRKSFPALFGSLQGSAAQQTVSKASASLWSALHDFAQRDQPVLAKGWDEVGPGHPFLFVYNF
jgi:hypothetical protein